MRQKGFTLIELVVVVGVLGVVMITISSVMINSFRAKNRVELTDKIERNGSVVLTELQNQISGATGDGMLCVGSTLTLVNATDGGTTNLICYEGQKIASASANGVVDLTTSDVAVSGCDSFVSCDLYPGSTDRVIQANMLIKLTIGDTNGGVSQYSARTFRTSVVVRN